MKKNPFALCCVLAALAITSCSKVNHSEHNHGIDEQYIDEQGNLTEPIDIATHQEEEGPKDDYNKEVVLVKSSNEIDASLLKLNIKRIEPLYPNALWKKIVLDGENTVSSVKYLRETGLFDMVDYDYIMGADADIESIDVSSNTYAEDLSYLDTMCIGDAWGYGNANNLGGPNGGGSPDVVIAIIDTGVDYNHLDLRNNIWTNTGEIPNNNIDDDGNGYVDDVHGWDCVNEDNDPIDDNGHGTHVAGIAAAENNNIGTVGVAFNCKIMPIKAGNSSGKFNNADIAQAIQYAYMSGASVINMSFGGPSISAVVEDALVDAYFQCSLIAAAGNSSLPGDLECPIHFIEATPFYPASLQYVVGVMSCDNLGTHTSTFSNFDDHPYNRYEYDCYACGEQIISTWPNNKYATMSGTSMSCPVVAGIAALLRSAYPDREVYSSKYIHSQLTNTGSKHVQEDHDHPICNAYNALTMIPKPNIYNLYRYYAFDNKEFSPNNNGDGFIDVGETIRIGIELQNRGGKAANVTAKIDTIRNGDPNLTDPNIEILTDTINFDDIGTYSVQDGGKIYDGDKVVNMTNAFVVKIAENAPNAYGCDINLHVEYYNGLENDGIKYECDCVFTITISSGYRISGTISEDTVFTSDKMYIVDDIVYISKNATVTFEAGTTIIFYSNSEGYINTRYNTPSFFVYGNLYFNGTADNRITMKPAENYWNFVFRITRKDGNSVVSINYADLTNIATGTANSNFCFDDGICLNHCSVKCTNHGGVSDWVFALDNGQQGMTYQNLTILEVNDTFLECYMYTNICCYSATNCTFEAKNGSVSFIYYQGKIIRNNLFVLTKTKITIALYGDDIVVIENNSFILDFVPKALSELTAVQFNAPSGPHTETYSVKGNVFDDFFKTYESALLNNNFDYDGSVGVAVQDYENHDDSLIHPYIKDISIFDNDELIHTVGVGMNTVRVTFSKEMDVSSEFTLYYGSTLPYADYKVTGDYISDTVWEGQFRVRANIEGGIQYFSSSGGNTKNNPYEKLYNNSGAFTFNIDISGVFAMNLQAVSCENGVELTWVQDDYDTLMGYNIYRSESENGYFTKINQSIIPAEENTFFDDSCEPGKVYWYTFTVVLTDFSESAPAGKVSASPLDTIAPTIYHTPVNQGYANNNLIISCTASDNIAITSVTLFYRTVGETNWKSLPMVKNNNRYSATIFGYDVQMEGLEYYIAASDGVNTITRGSSDDPYVVVIKDASLLNDLGDVDGDGEITTKDALMIIKAINNEIILSDDQFRRADLNKDNTLSTFEALRILQYINGNVNTLEM